MAASLISSAWISWSALGGSARFARLGFKRERNAVDHHNPKGRDGKDARDPGHGIIDSRGSADTVLGHRIHHNRGERRHGDRHSKTKNNNRRKKHFPVGAAASGTFAEQQRLINWRDSHPVYSATWYFI